MSNSSLTSAVPRAVFSAALSGWARQPLMRRLADNLPERTVQLRDGYPLTLNHDLCLMSFETNM